MPQLANFVLLLFIFEYITDDALKGRNL